jgi:taurine dioxygenase
MGFGISISAIRNRRVCFKIRKVKMRIEPLTVNIGAQIHDVDLATANESIFNDIQTSLWQHQVLVFRDQSLTRDSQLALGRRFGELHVHPALSDRDEHPEELILKNRGKSKTVTEVWHSDVSCDDRPPSVSILRAVDVPEFGGDTLWASQYAAFEALSEGLRNLLRPMNAVHINYQLAATHPVVRKHPETGREALYVNAGFTQYFENMTREESRPLLNYLVSVGSSSDISMRHRWQRNDVVMWDNRCVMHFAVHDYGDAAREMRRVTVRGEVPLGSKK